MTRHPVGMALSILAVVSIACFLMIGGIPGTDATEQTEGDFKFTVTDDVATIIGYTGTADDLTVPSQLGGKDVVAIAGSVFAENTNLKNVTIPSTVTSIGLRTFVGCTSLESVSLPTNLTELGSSAFKGCTSLKTVTIPASLTEIGSDAFSGCTSLGTVAFAPGSVLERICDGAFMDCVKLDGIVLPSTLKYLESSSYYATGSVFKGCTSLTSIIIPDGMLQLGNESFKGCTSLKTVTIGEDSALTTLGEYSFVDCSKLESLHVPKDIGTSPRFIWGTDFTGCSSLKSFTAHPDNPTYTAVDGILFSKTKVEDQYVPNNIIKYPAAKAGDTYIASETIKSLNMGAFDGCALLKTIDISNTTVTSVIYGVFKGCTSLETLRLPATIKNIDGTAFNDCTLLTAFDIPEGCEYFSTVDGVLFDETKRSLIRYPIAKTGASFNLPENTVSIEKGAFQGCSELTAIYVTGPRGTIDIGTGAFEGCNANLVTLSNGRTSCKSLELYSDASFETRITDIKTFEGTVFLRWDAETAVGGSNVTSKMTYDPYGGAVLLKYGGTESSITLPSVIGGADLVELAEALFRDRTDIVKVVIPDTVKTLGENLFEDCTSLSNVTLPSAIEEIPDYAFVDCKSLTSIIIPATVTNIGQTSFQRTGLIEIDIPDNVDRIEGYAFNECASLKTVNIGADSRLYSLGEHAFGKCGNLETIDLPADMGSLGAHCFDSCYKLSGTFVIPSVYKVPTGFLYSCTSLTKIVVSDGTAVLGFEALLGCSSVTELVLAGTLNTIDSKAVAGLDSLSKVTITDNTVVHFSVADNVLYELDDDTKALYEMRLYPCQDPRESYTVPAGVKWIDDYAMIDNPYLKTLTLPASIDTVAPSVNDWFLNGFESLENIYLNGENEHFQSVDGILFSKDGTVLVKYPAMHKVGGVAITSYTVPSEVDMILDFAFEYVGLLEEVFISDAVTTLDICTFQNSTSLKEVTLGDGVSTVLDSSFSACSSLETIFMSFPSSNTRTILVGLLEVGVMTNSNIIKPESGTGTILMTYPEWVGGDEKYKVVYTLSIGDYTISFDPNGGTGTMNNVDVPVEGSVALPANTFTYEKMDFTGWNTKADGSGSGYSDGQTVSGLSETPDAVVTLYAQWEIGEYTIDFNANGGTGTMASQVYDAHSTDTLDPNALTKTGYLFAGWDTKADGSGTAYADEASITNAMFSGQPVLELYAQWEPVAYSVKFDANTGAGTMADQQFVYDVAQKLTVNAFTKEDHEFISWNSKADGSGTAYTDGQEVLNLASSEDAVVTLYAQWEVHATYTIRFDPNGGTGTMTDMTVWIGDSVRLTANTFVRDGHFFDFWNTKADGTGDDYVNEQMVTDLSTEPDAVVTLYAQWYVGKYTVNFHPNNGVGEMFSIVVNIGEDIQIPEHSFFCDGHSFTGWNTEADGSGDAYTDKQVIPGGLSETDGDDVTLYAQWKVNQYTITFDTVGGSAVASITQDYGTPITAPADPTKDGYTFARWHPSVPATMPAEDMTFTAQWEINQYEFSFVVEGTPVSGGDLDYGAEIPVPENPSKTGYTFVGWTPAVPETMPAQDMVFTAQWKVNQYTITFDTVGGSAVASITQDYGTPITAPADPTKDGYTFAGWRPSVPATMPAEDMTIRAGWSVVVVNPDGSSTSTEVDTSTTTDGATVTTTTVTETDASGESKTNVTTDIPPKDEGGENVVKDEYVDVAIEQIETLPIDSDVPIVINVPVGDSGAASVSPGSMADISEIDAGLKITATIGSILLDKDVCEKMSSATENIRVSINKAVENDLTEAQKKAIGDRFALVLRAVSGSSDFHELGGNATVQIPYTLRDGQDASKLRLIHINDAGEKEIIESNYGNGIMNAKIGHFSVFYIDVVEENNGGGFPMIAIVGIVAAVVVVGVALFYIKSRN